MATIRKRGNSFQAQIRIENLPPKSASFKTRKEARDWATATEASLRDLKPQVSTSASEVTLGQLVLRYRNTIAIHKRGTGLKSTLTKFSTEPMCSKTLSRLALSDFISYRDRRILEVKPTSLKVELANISSVFRVASKEWGIKVPNFVAQLEFKAKSYWRIRRIDKGERAKILAAIMAEKSFKLETKELLKDIFVFAIETAMRKSELLRVKPEDYNPIEGTLYIPLTKIDEPRLIGLSPEACKILDKRSSSNPCFPIHTATLEKAWQKVKRKAGVKDLHFHDTRHEGISNYFDLGLSVMEVAQQSGHKDFKMLARYSHAKVRNIVNKLKEAA